MLKYVFLRKIYGPYYNNGEWRIRWNHELYELYGEIELSKQLKLRRLCWLGYIARLDTSARVRRGFVSVPGGCKRRRGWPNLRWEDQALSTAAAFGISNGRQKQQIRKNGTAY